MTYNLFDITYRVARELNNVKEGQATGGSATTLIDTTYLSNKYADDRFNDGTIWLLYDAAGAGASPQGKWGRITDFVASTGTVTFTPTMTDAIASGDRYALSIGRWTLDDMISKINAALADILISNVDKSTVTTAANKTEYTLPTAILGQSIQVDFQGYSGDETDDNRWVPWHDWYIEETGTGTANTLIMRSQPLYPYDLRITYFTPHPALYAYTDKLRESVSIDRVVLDAAYRCLLSKAAEPSTKDPEVKARIAELMPRVERARWRSPARVSRPKLATYGDIDNAIPDIES